MKKYIIGALFGFLLSIAFTAGAAEIKNIMIGKVIQGSFPLIIDGVQAEKDVIVVDKTSYIPVKVAGELFGYDVSFIDSTVKLNPIEGIVNSDKLIELQLAELAKKEQKDMDDEAQLKNEKEKERLQIRLDELHKKGEELLKADEERAYKFKKEELLTQIKYRENDVKTQEAHVKEAYDFNAAHPNGDMKIDPTYAETNLAVAKVELAKWQAQLELLELEYLELTNP